MTTDRLETDSAVAAVEPTVLPQSVRSRIFLYLGALVFLMAFGSPTGGLFDIPISFFLKNKLNLTAHEVANFRLVAAIPLYLAFVFGFVRDIWNPLGLGDRGFIILFGAACAGFYALFAFIPISYGTLLIALVLQTTSFLFVSSALHGLTSVLGQQHAMSGQVSAAWNVVTLIPTILALYLGGMVSDMLEGRNADEAARMLFLAGALIMATTAAYGAWRAGSVFDNIRSEQRPDTHPLEDVRRMLRHWPIYPALLIWLLWTFAPGSVTPLQYYLQNTLHASDAQWGEWNAIFAAAFIPTFLIYGVLCQKYPLRVLLVWGTVFAIPQMVPLLFIDSVTAALIAAFPMGLMGGIATGAYYDLIIRSCPPGLQGTTLMMASSLYFVAARFGDVLGTYLYDHFGNFTVCVIAITVVYALILPGILLIPKRLIATADGQTSAGH